MSGIRGVSGLQVAIATTLSSRVDVYRKMSVADTSGGEIDTYTKVSTLPCSYTPAPLIPRERESTIQARSIIHWNFNFPADADVVPTDRLYLGSRVFEVVGGGPASINIFSQVTCEEIL